MIPPLPPRDPDLAEFERPPVDEVVIGLQFQGPSQSAEALVADYRETVKDEYPSVQYQPRLPPSPPLGQIAVAPTPGIVMMGGSAQLQDALNRIWLVSPDDSRVIQVQSDRFVHNWRRRVDEYPRFENLYRAFWERFVPFRQLVEERGDKIYVQQVEVSYINWVRDSEMLPSEYLKAAQAGQLHLSFIETEVEQSGWQSVVSLREGGVPISRLVLQCQGGAIRVDRTDVMRGSTFNLTFLAAPEPGATDERIAELMALGRRTIVDAFSQLTTPEAQARWQSE